MGEETDKVPTRVKEALHREAKAQRAINYLHAEALRYNERTTVERVNARPKDDYGGRHVRVRGQAKVFCHLMPGSDSPAKADSRGAPARAETSRRARR